MNEVHGFGFFLGISAIQLNFMGMQVTDFSYFTT